MTGIKEGAAVLLAAFACATAHSALSGSGPASSVPFRMVVSGGNPRPIVTALFNGHPMPMMVHSNASFFSQLKHSQAAAFGVRLVGDHKAFGIDRPGHVSALGQDRGIVTALRVGAVVDRNAPVSVFEVPQDRYGMLGVGWIIRHRLVLDYAASRMTVSPSGRQVANLAASLRRKGYVALPLAYDANEQRFSVFAAVNGVTRRMNIGTASEFSLDSDLARIAHVATGADEGHGSGPTGTHVPNYRLGAPVRIRIRAWISPPIGDGRVFDTYAYNGEKRPADPTNATGGDLGGGFLLATRAVVDFGLRILYVRGT